VEIYEHDCPYYLALGMTYDQYWYGDPLMVRAYYKADRIRQQRMNDEAWLYGAYVLRAMQSALSVSDLFRPKGQHQGIKYPEKPIEVDGEEKDELYREQREEQEALYAQAYMMNMVMSGKNWGKPK